MCVIAISVLLLIPQSVLAAEGLKDAQFLVPVEDRGVEETNGAFKTLRLIVPIHVNFEGSYYVLGSMRQSGIHTEVATEKTLYRSGSYDLSLDFDGKEIYRSGVDGPYKIDLTLLSDKGEPIDVANHTTRAYSYEDFNTTKVNTNIPEIDIQYETVRLKFRDLTAEVYKTLPMVRYYYTEDKDSLSMSLFKVSRIIAYDDANGNGIPEQSEIKYTANLLNAFWEFSIRFDNVYEIKLNAELVLKDADFAPGPHISVTFVYSALSDPSSAYNLPLHMEIVCKAPYSTAQIDTKNLAVETMLMDESGGRGFGFDSGLQTGSLAKKGKAQNYVRWERTYSMDDDKSGSSTDICMVNAAPSPEVQYIYATFNVTQFTNVIVTTMNVGVTQGNYIEPEPPYEHKIWLYGLGIALAILVVLATFKLQRRKAKKEVM